MSAASGRAFVPFGRETVYVARLYLQRVFVVAAVVMAIVLGLDIASNMATVLAPESVVSGLDGPGRLAFYALLRAGYVLPSILPIAAIMGVVWSEFVLAVTHERIMIFNSGRAPLASLMPAALVGLLIGLLQFSALAYVRPASVEAQAVNTFRYYGPRFQRPVITPPRWIAAEGAIINARIEIGEGVSLRDVVVYELDDLGKLKSIVSARTAHPTATGRGWLFREGTNWDFPPAQAGETQEGVARTEFRELAGGLNLNPVWVENFGLPGPLMPQRDLAVLAAAPDGVPQAFGYRTAYHDRFANILYPLGLTLAGAALSLVLFSPRMHPAQAMKIGLFGGGAHIASSIMAMLGTYGRLPAAPSVWIMPLMFIGVALALVATGRYRPRPARRGAAGPLLRSTDSRA